MDTYGGAAIATYRLHKEFLRKGIDSKLLVKVKYGNDDSVLTYNNTKSKKLLSKITSNLERYPLRFIHGVEKDEMSLSFLPDRTIEKINEMDADIVHLNWINSAFINIKNLYKINKKIVWTLHDMWAFTGAEHYVSVDNCRYKIGYFKNNRPPKESGIDINKLMWRKKLKSFKRIRDLSVVTPSKWLGDCAKESILLRNFNITVIPNGIDINKFKPIDKNVAREILCIPKDKKVILFGAINADACKRKGFYLLKSSLKKFFSDKSVKNFIMVTFGAKNPDFDINELSTINYGHLYDEISLNVLYSAADVMIVPSEVESFGLTILESLASATPVVAFNSGGQVDLIKHKQNGFLAEINNTDSLAEGMQWLLCLEKKEKLTIEHNARLHIEQNFSIDRIAEKYIDIYEKLL